MARTGFAAVRATMLRIARVLPLLFASAVPMATAAQSVGDSSNRSDSEADALIGSPELGWPQWRGRRRDGISEETGLLARWPAAGPRLIWKITGLGIGWSSPIVVGDRLFLTGDVERELIIYAYARKGKLIWRAKNGRAWTGSYPGARACCLYSDGCLYNMNAHGRVVCLDADSGHELWSVNVLDRFGGREITWGLSECLLADGPQLIVTPGGRRALMAALDKRTGRTVWTTPPLGSDVVTHSSPILFRWQGRRLIAQCSSEHGFGVDADTGELLWRVPLRNQYGVNVATPIYGDGCLYYVTPYGELGRLYRLQARGDSVAAEHIWTAPLDTVTGCGLLVNGVLYSARYRPPRHWYAVDWRTGSTISELTELTTGAAIYADGHLYCFDERGTLALVRPNAGRMKLISSLLLIPRRVRDAWAHPVLCDGRLYIRYHDTLWCFDVRSQTATSK